MGAICFATWPSEVLLLFFKFLDLPSFIRLKTGYRSRLFMDIVGFYHLCTGHLCQFDDYSFAMFLPFFFGFCDVMCTSSKFMGFLHRLSGFKNVVVRGNHLHMALRLTRVESLIIVLWSLNSVDIIEQVLSVEPTLRFLIYGGKSICLIPLCLEYLEDSGWRTGIHDIQTWLWQQKCNQFLRTCKSLWLTNPGSVVHSGRVNNGRFSSSAISYAQCHGCALRPMDFSITNQSVGALGFNSAHVKELFLDAFVRSFGATQMSVEIAITSTSLEFDIELSKEDGCSIVLACVAYGSSLGNVVDFIRNPEIFMMRSNLLTSSRLGYGADNFFNTTYQPELLWRHDALNIVTVVHESMQSDVLIDFLL